MPGKIFFILFILFCAIPAAIAQKNVKRTSPDTIVIYETKVVYDTLYVYDTIRMANPIKNIPVLHLGQADTASRLLPLPYDIVFKTDTSLFKINSKSNSASSQPHKTQNNIFLIPLDKNYRTQPDEFLCKSPATILKSDIINAESDKEMMENKTSPLGTLDKFRFGISAGGGGWWAQSFDFTLRSGILASPNVGIFFETSTTQNISLKVELNYSWLLKNGIKFYRDDFMGTVYSSSFTSSNYSDIFTWDIDGDAESGFNFSQISIPVKVGYKIMFFQPYVGLELKTRFTRNRGDYENFFSVLAGVDIFLSNKLSLAVNYSFGMSEELYRNAYTQATTLGNMIVLPDSTVVFFPYSTEDYINNSSGPLSSQRIDFSLYLNLFRTKRNR